MGNIDRLSIAGIEKSSLNCIYITQKQVTQKCYYILIEHMGATVTMQDKDNAIETTGKWHGIHGH